MKYEFITTYISPFEQYSESHVKCKPNVLEILFKGEYTRVRSIVFTGDKMFFVDSGEEVPEDHPIKTIVLKNLQNMMSKILAPRFRN